MDCSSFRISGKILYLSNIELFIKKYLDIGLAYILGGEKLRL